MGGKISDARAKCERLGGDLTSSCIDAVDTCSSGGDSLKRDTTKFSIFIEVNGKMKEFKDLTFDKCLSMSPLLPKIYKSKIEKVVAHGTKPAPEPRPAPRPEPRREPRPQPRPEPEQEPTDVPKYFPMTSTAGMCWAFQNNDTKNKTDARNNMLDKAGVYAFNLCPAPYTAAEKVGRIEFTRCTNDKGKPGFKARAKFQCVEPEEPDQGLQDFYDEGVEAAEELMKRR